MRTIIRTFCISLILSISGSLYSCITQKGLTEKDIIIAIETTACMGSCPVFRAEIYGNGYIIYEGKQHVERTGIFIGRLSGNTLNELKEEFESSGFFSMENEYVKPWTDLPTIYLFYSNRSKQKRIKDYYGAPEELKNLEREVIEVIENVKLKKRGGTFLLTK